MQTTSRTALPSGVAGAAKALATKAFRHALPSLAALALLAGSAAAQQQPIVKPGSAVVTGYSGFVSFPAPEGGDPFDYLTVNTSGPAARVIDLTSPGAQGVPSPAPKTFTVTASQVGQVFGVTLDNAPQPNIYLAATSAYGLAIHIPDGSGTLKRVHQGAPGAQFVPGQFGPPEWGAGPGSIWRVSGSTGQVSLFTAVGTGSFASLGGLAYDPATQQVFAADRGSGIIYRIGLDGLVKGTYDHGVEGRPGAGLPPIAAAPALPANLASPAFSPDNPATWGFAPPARRVFALAVYNKRLYYSIGQGPQIWSAGISPSGSIPGKDARIEVEVPSLADGVEIASITFDSAGRMYLAERGRTTGDYYLYNLADASQSRVLRYLPKPAGDPAPGRWKLMPEQYSIGLPPNYNNANGGVALNYGYNQAGQINLAQCGANVWTTGERLLDPGDGSTPDTFPTLDGLQGNAASAVQPQNTPPTQSWFVDYDDQPGHFSFRGYMGAIATIPCAAPTPPPAPPPPTCPPGTYFQNGQCLIFPTCPPGTQFQNGQCVYPQCPPGYVLQGGQCVPPTIICPPGNVFYNGQCVPLNCPPGLIRLPNGFCACPQNLIYANGQCVPPNQCPPGAIQIGGICFCPNGLLQGGQCEPFFCPPGQVLTIEGCKPIVCPPGQEIKNGQCVPITCPPNKDLFNNKCVPKCPPNQVHTMPDGVCQPLLCGFPLVPFNGQCVPPCPPGFKHSPPNGVCVPDIIVNPCPPTQELYNGQCVDKCQQGFVHLPPNGVCGLPPPPQPCLPPNEMWNGLCVPKCGPLQQHFPPNGACGPGIIIDPDLPILCLPPNEMINGDCKAPCPPNTHRLPNGMCVPNIIVDPPIIDPPGPIIDLPILCLQPNEMVNGNCVPPCPPNTHRLPNGSCAPNIIVDPPIIKPPIIDLPILCLQPNEMVNGNCVPPCPPNTHRLPNGNCVPNLIVDPVLPKPPIFNPDLQINPDLQLIPPPPPPCNPPNQMVNGECKPPVVNPDLQINPGLLLPGLQLQMNP